VPRRCHGHRPPRTTPSRHRAPSSTASSSPTAGSNPAPRQRWGRVVFNLGTRRRSPSTSSPLLLLICHRAYVCSQGELLDHPPLLSPSLSPSSHCGHRSPKPPPSWLDAVEARAPKARARAPGRAHRIARNTARPSARSVSRRNAVPAHHRTPASAVAAAAVTLDLLGPRKMHGWTRLIRLRRTSPPPSRPSACRRNPIVAAASVPCRRRVSGARARLNATVGPLTCGPRR
jgi:hypothetical protein